MDVSGSNPLTPTRQRRSSLKTGCADRSFDDGVSDVDHPQKLACIS
jgi:hypothetical protein